MAVGFLAIHFRDLLFEVLQNHFDHVKRNMSVAFQVCEVGRSHRADQDILGYFSLTLFWSSDVSAARPSLRLLARGGVLSLRLSLLIHIVLKYFVKEIFFHYKLHRERLTKTQLS